MKNIIILSFVFVLLVSNAFSAPEIEYKSKKDSNELISFNWTYPIISGLEDKTAQNMINDFYFSDLEDSYKELLQMAQDESKARKDSNLEAPPQFQSVNKCKAEIIFDNYLTVKTELYEYIGGAHGSTRILYDLFDALSGERIPVKNFFNQDSNYLVSLAEICAPELQAQLEKDSCEYFEEGTASTETNYKNIGLTKDGIVVVFGQYQVAPYTCGVRYVNIPFDRIKDLLNTNVLEFLKR